MSTLGKAAIAANASIVALVVLGVLVSGQQLRVLLAGAFLVGIAILGVCSLLLPPQRILRTISIAANGGLAVLGILGLATLLLSSNFELVSSRPIFVAATASMVVPWLLTTAALIRSPIPARVP